MIKTYLKTYRLSDYSGTEETAKDMLLRALIDLASFDNDLNGANGEECLWDIAKEKGFETNLDYLIEKTKSFDNSDDMVSYFLDSWMGIDGYYNDYKYDLIGTDNDIILSVAFSVDENYDCY